jgi:hypothetical protein
VELAQALAVISTPAEIATATTAGSHSCEPAGTRTEGADTVTGSVPSAETNASVPSPAALNMHFTSDIFPLETPMPQPTATSTDNRIADTIRDRDNQYGNYEVQAKLAQTIKQTFVMPGEVHVMLPPDMRESLEMIATKISRILCGNCDNPDNWHDIAGYATLIENRLRKQQQK